MRMPGAHKSHIFILTAGIHEGKSSFLQKVVATLEKDLKIAGFISQGCWEDGERTGFILREAVGQRSAPLAGKAAGEGSFPQGRFHFRPEAFESGMAWAREGLQAGARLLVIDEVGPLELKREGWFPLMEEVCKTGTCACLWVVRESCLQELKNKWNIPKNKIHKALPGRETALEKSILDYVRNNESTSA